MSVASAPKPRVVFLCVHNAGRSQMAAGWLRHLAGDGAEVFSGGSDPAAEVNPSAVAVMAEVGIDIGDRIPRRWTDDVVRSADAVITMGCGDSCPVFPGVRYVDWDLDDPAGLPIEEVRPIRDEIERRVRGLMTDLAIPAIEGRGRCARVGWPDLRQRLPADVVARAARDDDLDGAEVVGRRAGPDLVVVPNAILVPFGDHTGVLGSPGYGVATARMF